MTAEEAQLDRFVEDLVVDRVDLAARLLALKEARPDPGGLLERAGSRLAGLRGGDDEAIAAVTTS